MPAPQRTRTGTPSDLIEAHWERLVWADFQATSEIGPLAPRGPDETEADFRRRRRKYRRKLQALRCVMVNRLN